MRSAFDWRGIHFAPLLDHAEWIEASWLGDRHCWSVTKPDGGVHTAQWDVPGHPNVVGTGASPQAALDDCMRQLRLALKVVVDEVAVRIARRDLLTDELARCGGE